MTASARVTARLAMSLDGYIADSQGGYGWICPDTDDHLDTGRQHSFEEYLDGIDIVVMGARCFEQGQAAQFTDKQVYVATSADVAAQDNIRFFGSDIIDVVRQEKDRGRTTFLFGGGVLVSSFLRQQTVDELFIGIVPVLLGSGRSLFCGEYPARELTLADYSITSGKVRLKYVSRSS